MWCPTKNLGPIGSAVLTFIGYKQTNKQTDRQAKFIHRFDIGFSPLQKYDTERGRKEDKEEESGKCWIHSGCL